MPEVYDYVKIVTKQASPGNKSKRTLEKAPLKCDFFERGSLKCSDYPLRSTFLIYCPYKNRFYFLIPLFKSYLQ